MVNDYESYYRYFVQDYSRNQIRKDSVFWSNSIDPCEVLNSVSIGEEDHSFWNQHGESLDRYKELIFNYIESINQISRFGSLDHLSLSDPVHMAYQAFHGSEPIDLIEYQGKLLLNNNGRHRVAAARILHEQGVDIKIPGRITRYIPVNKPPEQSNSYKQNLNAMAHRIEQQIELLEQAESLFAEHAEKVQELTDHFSAGVRALEQDELNHDYMDLLEEFLSDYIIKLKTIRETIEDEYLPKLQRKIIHLEER